jgi:hypothetical protein
LARVAPGSNSFYVGGPCSSAGTGGAISGTRCMVPICLLLEGTGCTQICGP